MYLRNGKIIDTMRDLSATRVGELKQYILDKKAAKQKGKPYGSNSAAAIGSEVKQAVKRVVKQDLRSPNSLVRKAVDVLIHQPLAKAEERRKAAAEKDFEGISRMTNAIQEIALAIDPELGTKFEKVGKYPKID